MKNNCSMRINRITVGMIVLLAVLAICCLAFVVAPVSGTASADTVERTSSLNMVDGSQYNNGTSSVYKDPERNSILDSVEGWKWYLTAADGYEAKTLVLDGLTLTGTSKYGIKLPADSTIYLAPGSVNTVTAGIGSGADNNSTGIHALGNLTIDGTGTLNANGDFSHYAINTGIYVEDGNLTIKGGIINSAAGSQASAKSFGIYVLGSISSSEAKVTATPGATVSTSGETAGIYATGSMTINSGIVTATGGKIGLQTGDTAPQVTMTGGTLTAQGSSKAVNSGSAGWALSDGGTLRAGAASPGAVRASTTSDKYVNVSYPSPIYDNGYGKTDLMFNSYKKNSLVEDIGYTFAGWFDGDVELTAAADGVANVTYTAKWLNQGHEIIKSVLDFSDDTESSSDAAHGWAYEYPAKILTLSGAAVEATGTEALILPDGATVNLAEGSNNVFKSGTAASGITAAVKGLGTLTVGGTGTLKVYGGTSTATWGQSFGLYSESAMTINGGTIIAEGGRAHHYSSAIRSGETRFAIAPEADYSIHINGGNITATGGTANRYSFGIDGLPVFIKDCTIVATGGEVVEEGNANDDNASGGIYTAKSIENSTVTATGGKSYFDSYGLKLYSKSSTEYSNIISGTVTATGGYIYRTHSDIGSVTCGLYGSANISGGTVKSYAGQPGSGVTAAYGAYGAYNVSDGSLYIDSESHGSALYGNINATGGEVTLDYYADCGLIQGTITTGPGAIIKEGTSSANNSSVTGGYAEGKQPAYTAQYVNITFGGVITFAANNGQFGTGSEAVTSKEVIANETTKLVTVPAENPTRTGYSFDSWNTKADGTGTTFDATAQIIDSAIVYAKWTANTDTAYKVEHYQQNLADDDYTIVTADTESKTGTTAAKTAAAPKTYTGFATVTDGEKAFAQADIAANGSTVVKVYYNRDKYTVRYMNGTTVAQTTANLKYGAATPAYAGSAVTKAEDNYGTYAFKDWGTVATTVSANADYVAQYTLTAKTYTLTLNLNGGTATGAPANYTAKAEYVLPTPTKTDYAFGGWYGDATFTGTALTKIPADAYGTKEYYAKWLKTAISDETTGAKIENADGIAVAGTLVVEKKDIDTAQDEKVKAELGANYEIKASYDLKLMDDETEIQPDGSVRVTMAIPEGIKADGNITVVYFAPDGTMTEYEVTVEEGSIVFIMPTTRPYSIVAEKEEAPSAPADPAGGLSGGDIAGIVIGILLFLILLLLGLYTLWKYEKLIKGDLADKLFRPFDKLAIKVCRAFHNDDALFTLPGTVEDQEEAKKAENAEEAELSEEAHEEDIPEAENAEEAPAEETSAGPIDGSDDDNDEE